MKNLKQKGRWFKTSRTGLYEEYVISSGMIKDIAEAKRKKLELAGVTKLLQLKQLTVNLAAIKSLASILPGVGIKSLQKWIDQDQQAKPGAAPPIIDHTTHDHPYQSLFQDKWEEVMENCTSLNHTVQSKN